MDRKGLSGAARTKKPPPQIFFSWPRWRTMGRAIVSPSSISCLRSIASAIRCFAARVSNEGLRWKRPFGLKKSPTGIGSTASSSSFSIQGVRATLPSIKRASAKRPQFGHLRIEARSGPKRSESGIAASSAWKRSSRALRAWSSRSF